MKNMIEMIDANKRAINALEEVLKLNKSLIETLRTVNNYLQCKADKRELPDSIPHEVTDALNFYADEFSYKTKIMDADIFVDHGRLARRALLSIGVTPYGLRACEENGHEIHEGNCITCYMADKEVP